MLCVLVFKISTERNTRHKTIFTAISIGTIILLVSDSINWLVDGHPEQILIVLNSLALATYYFMHFVVLSLWALYVWTITNPERKIPSLLIMILTIACLSFLVLVVSNTWNGLLYTIDENNSYYRGVLFIPFAVACAVLLAFALCISVQKRRILNKGVFATLVLFPVLPLIGAVAQAFFFGLPLIWTLAAFTIFVVYINIQNDLVAVDQLTGTYSRVQIMSLLKRKLKKRNASFAVIMIDIDDFKTINDTYGHLEGDSALEEVPVILREAIRPIDFVSRIGGDEFLVLLDVDTESGLSDIIERIGRSIVRRNNHTSKSYHLSLSIGASVFCAEEYGSVAQVMAKVDGLMYAEKRQKKA